MIELQARWIAYVWSGALPGPSLEEMESGIADYQARRGGPQVISMSTLVPYSPAQPAWNLSYPAGRRWRRRCYSARLRQSPFARAGVTACRTRHSGS
jgi:hypothetical protein